MANTSITTILKNGQQGHASVRFTATDTLLLTDLATPNTSIEVMTGLAIANIYWTGDWKITRNGNTVFQTANNVGAWDFYKTGTSLTDQPSSNIVATTAGTSSTLIINLAKQSTVTFPFV